MSPEALKPQDKALAEGGAEITRSRALELVAQSVGARDWNTFTAQTSQNTPVWQVGQAVVGRYL